MNPGPKHSYTIIKDSTFNCVATELLGPCVCKRKAGFWSSQPKDLS